MINLVNGLKIVSRHFQMEKNETTAISEVARQDMVVV